MLVFHLCVTCVMNDNTFPPSVVTLAMNRELWSSFDEHRSVWYRKRSSHAPGFFEEQNNTTSVWRFGAAVRHFWNAVSLVRQGQQQMEPDRKDDFFPPHFSIPLSIVTVILLGCVLYYMMPDPHVLRKAICLQTSVSPCSPIETDLTACLYGCRFRSSLVSMAPY